MKYSILALAALLVPPQAIIVQACDASGHGVLLLAPSDVATCNPWPSCTTWTAKNTARRPVLENTRAPARADSGDVLVGEYDLTSGGEFVRLYLERGRIYRVEFSSSNGALDIRPRDRSAQPLLPLAIEDIPRASGTRAVEIAPRSDGEYEFRAVGVRAPGAQLRVVAEAKPSARWQRLAGRKT